MKQRIITALILIAFISIILFVIPVLFIPMIAIMLGVSVWEWCLIAKITGNQRYTFALLTVIFWLVALFSPMIFTILLMLSTLHYLYATRLIINYERSEHFRISDAHLMWAGPVILATLAATFFYIFHFSGDDNRLDDALTLTFAIMIIASADSGAYFVGRAFGKRKLASRVSPKKTIEGLIGGVICATVIAGAFNTLLEGWALSLWQILVFSIIATLFSVIGDLFISIIKRQNNIKDASNILPGHGGILDRIDGLLAGIPVFYLLQQFA